MTADVERDAALARSLAGGAGLASGDGGVGDRDAAAASAAGPFDPHATEEEDRVRAPIPVMRDTLYGPAATYYRGGGVGVVSGGNNNGAAAGAGNGAAAAGPSRLPQRRPNDTRPRAAGAFSASDIEREAEAAAKGSNRKSAPSSQPLVPPPPPPAKGLAGLFAPPQGLLFSGDFQQAAEAAATSRRWLVANVQAEAEFASHRLNRDTWNDPTLKMLLSESFVFWQGDASAEDGATVAQHYRLLPPAVAEAAVEAAVSAGRAGGGGRRRDPLPGGDEQRGGQGQGRQRPPTPAEVARLIPPGALPAILVVDPATGLAMRTWTGFVAADRLAEELGPFLDHAFDEPGARELAAAGAAAARRRRRAAGAAAGSAAAAAAVAGMAMTEEEELAAALALSAAEAHEGGEEEVEEDEDDGDSAAAAEEEAEKEEEERKEAPAPPPPSSSSPPPIVAPEPAEGVPRLSVALRLPDGGRASRAFARTGATLADLFEWCRSLLPEERREGESTAGSRREFRLKEPFPGAAPMAREGAEGVSLESVCGGGGGATFLLHFVD